VKNIPIIAKFLSVMGIFGVFSLAVAVYCTMQMRTIDMQYTTLLDGRSAASLDIARASRDLQTARASIGELMISTTQAENDSASAAIDSATQAFGSYMDEAVSEVPEHAADVQTVKANALDALSRACATAIAQGKAATSPTQVISSQQEFLNNCAPKFPALTQALSDLNNTLTTETKTQGGALSQLTSSTVMLTYIGIIVGLIAVMIGGFFAIRAWVITPVKGLQGVMGRLAGGDLNARVDGVERGDEIGGMARAVQVFKDAGLEKLRLEAEAKALQARADAEREQAEAERAEAAKRLAFVVSSLADALEKLSKGDLVLRLSTPFSAEYEKLRTDFNAAMETLQQTMKAIAANTHGVRSGAGEITQASDDLSRRTEQQAASLEETAAALDQITATVRRTAENANNARSEVAAAKSDAERSGQVVRETVTAMTGIESSSKQIGNIIGVIDEIAFQTNLLALNAGVEAARAGDAGRGFAVVATEVRALAQRSAEAAKEIKSLISASSQQVDSGVKLVAETGRALERIVAQVLKLNELVGDIAASAQEQATGLNEVNTAVNQMDQVTQQNAAMVEQATAASHSLSGEAEELSRLVGQFKIDLETTRMAPPPPVRKPAPPKVALRARAGAHAQASKVVSITHKAGAAPAIAGTEEWDDF
jgi:methyl-accepting chemotaxis protein